MSQTDKTAAPKKDLLDRAADLISGIMIFVCIAFFTVMVFSVAYGVIGRYVPFIRNPRWTQELAILCMVWLCFVSSGYAIKNGLHVRMTILVNLFPAKVRAVITRLTYVLLLAVNVFFCGLWTSADVSDASCKNVSNRLADENHLSFSGCRRCLWRLHVIVQDHPGRRGS